MPTIELRDPCFSMMEYTSDDVPNIGDKVTLGTKNYRVVDRQWHWVAPEDNKDYVVRVYCVKIT